MYRRGKATLASVLCNAAELLSGNVGGLQEAFHVTAYSRTAWRKSYSLMCPENVMYSKHCIVSSARFNVIRDADCNNAFILHTFFCFLLCYK